MLLTVLLWLLALGPAYVLSWKGCWSLLDLLLLPADKALSAVVSLALGVAVGVPLVFLHGPLTEAAEDRRALAALHHFVSLEVQVLLWRGGWMLLDLTLGMRTLGSYIGGLTAAVVMAGAGCLPTAGAGPPVPHRRGADPGTITEAPAAARALLMLLPALAACVFLWHGAWDAMDAWIPPTAPVWQGGAMLGVSTVAVAVLVTLPHCLGWVSAPGATDPGGERPRRLLRRLREDLLAAALIAAVVGYWKGLFDLAGRLAVPGWPGLADAALMMVGFSVVALADRSARTYALGGVLWSDGDLRWLQAMKAETDGAPDQEPLVPPDIR